MTDYKEILRLQALGLSKQAIATSVGCSRNTVRSALAAAEANGVTWENSRGTSNEALRKRLYPGSAERPASYTEALWPPLERAFCEAPPASWLAQSPR